MIKFLRQFRQNMISEGKTGRYLKYAIGEIVLVVIGILIALQINNWNENRKEYNKSRDLLAEFRKDLARDTVESNYVTGMLERQIKIESWTLHLVKYKKSQFDSLRMVFYGPYYQQPMTVRTYHKLQNSENPNLTGFPDLQNNLTKYYTDTKYLLDAFNEEEKHFAFDNEINQVIRSKLEMDLTDFPMLPQENAQDELLIDFAQSIEGRNFVKENYIRRKGMKRYFEKVKEEAKELIELINTNLEGGS
ncbi:MAG: DUF6090 family protein [Lutimonas sp.]